MARWAVKAESDRIRWDFRPLAGVGPLSFGTGLTEVAQALGKVPPSVGSSEWTFEETGVATYFAGGRLKCIALDALAGPQVSFAGMNLTGSVPSQADDALLAYAEAHHLPVRFTPPGGPAVLGLGLLLHIQRADDVLLTRPVFFVETDLDPWDFVPASAWRRF